MTRPSILVTGAGGFVGSHLAEGFHGLGYRVTALDAAFDRSARHRLAGQDLHEARLDRETMDGLSPADIVLHAAALTSTPEELGLSAADHIKANLDAMLVTLDFAVRKGARAFVFVSSSGVFAPDDATQLLLENVQPTATGAYALAKRAGELIAAGSASPTLSVVVVRLGYLYGPFEAARASRTHVSLVRRWLDDARAGRPLVVETPETRRDWTYVRDLPAALDRLLGSGTTGLVHLGSGLVHADRDVAETIARLTRAPVEIRPVHRAPGAKAPMGVRSQASVLDGMAWTALPEGIAEILAVEGAA